MGLNHGWRGKAPSDMRARPSVRTWLTALIIGVLLPPLVFSGFLVIRSAGHEQETMMDEARGRTRMAAAAVERELLSLRLRLLMLAGGLSLQTSDLGDFHAQAQEAFGDMMVVLSSAEGREIVNTAVAYGEPLSSHADLAVIRHVAETRQPRVSNMTWDPLTHRPLLTINVPVTRDSRLVYVLSLDIAATVPRMLSQLDLPAEWVAAVFDRQGRMIGRTRDPDRFVGTLARPDFIRHVQSENEGWFEGASREGVPLFSAFAHTRMGGWTVNIGIPRDLLLAPVRRSTWNLLWLGALSVAAATALAVFIGRRIAAPIIGLVPVARAVGQGEPPASWRASLHEADMVARSLFEAGTRLQRFAAAQRTAIGSLRQSEQRYRALADDLARVDAERTALLNRAVAAEENERKRIARELHDSLAQYLTALHLGLEKLGQSHTDTARREARDGLKSLLDALGQAVSRLAWDLRPVALDELGLHSAVDHYLEEWAERAGLRVDAAITLGGRVLPPVIETTLFRVLQEATTNVLRHARASRVGVILEATRDEARLIVEDVGQGFPAPGLSPAGLPPLGDEHATPAPRQLGLLGIRERLALVHGTLYVESLPGQGTTLFIRVPLSPEQQPPCAAPLHE